MKSKRTKYLHIAIIVLGIIFISVPIFHNNLWFDESYSVGMASKSFVDIWQIGSNDVHPILYYWILHIIYLVFGSNIYLYRFASMIPIAILGILGYTHIRKDFGNKVGMLFSFFTFFLPISCVYSGEIRMYTWAMLFVTIMAIYAYRIYKNSTPKNWIIFAIFSLASSYTHYYALATAGIINVTLFIYLIYKSVKLHKQNKLYTKELKYFTISAIVQIILYLPWLFCLIKQFTEVSNGFWIQDTSLETLLQIFCFQFTGNLDITFVQQWVAITLGIILLAYTIYSMVLCKKLSDRKENVAAYLAIGVYGIVLISLFIISIKTPILYARYFLNLTGLFIFFMAFFIAKGGKKVLTVIICCITLMVAGLVNINVIKMNYAQSNKEPLEYIKQDLKDGDMVLFGNRGSGFTISMQLINVPNCFYDYENWNVEPAYKAFGKEMMYINDIQKLSDYKGRIWIIDSDDYRVCRDIIEKYQDKINLIKQEKFSTQYHQYQYAITLIQKN